MRRHVPGGNRAPRLPFFLALLFLQAGLPAVAGALEVDPGAGPAPKNHFSVPAGRSRIVFPLSGQVPRAVADHWQQVGSSWGVLWDSLTETPRLLWPRAPFALTGTVPVSAVPPDSLISAVRSFLAERSELLGVSLPELGAPHVYTLAQDWVLLFPQQTLGGLRVRGASLRVVVSAEGQLRYLKAFLVKSPSQDHGPLLSREDALAAAGVKPGEVRSAELQLGFLSESDLRNTQEIWCLWVEPADVERPIEEVCVNARTGTVLERRVPVKHFGGVEDAAAPPATINRGVVHGSFPGHENFFATPWVEKGSTQPLRQVIVVDAPPPGQGAESGIAVTDEHGEFDLFTAREWPVRLFARLETADLTEAGVLIPLVRVPVANFQGGQPGDQDGIFRLDRRLDLDLDGVPDALQTHTGPERLEYLLDDPEQRALEGVGMAWAFQCSQLSTNMLSTFRRFALDRMGPGQNQESLFSTIRELELWSTNQLDIVRNSKFFPGGVFRSPRVLAPLGQLATGVLPAVAVQDAACPTYLLHEVGHHLFRHLTGRTSDASPDDELEEAMADLLTALHTQSSGIGYLEDGTGLTVPLPGARNLADEEPVSPEFGIWRRAAHVLWKFREAVTAADPAAKDLARHLVFLFLAYNRVHVEDLRQMDASHDLLAELLVILESGVVDGAKDPQLRGRHAEILRTTLRNAPLFDPPFLRGDSNQDGKLDISDAQRILHFLFQGGGPTDECLNAMDADDNSTVELTDAIRLLHYLFLGAGPLPAPFPGCGHDPDEPGTAENLGCRVSYCFFAL